LKRLELNAGATRFMASSEGKAEVIVTRPSHRTSLHHFDLQDRRQWGQPDKGTGQGGWGE